MVKLDKRCLEKSYFENLASEARQVLEHSWNGFIKLNDAGGLNQALRISCIAAGVIGAFALFGGISGAAIGGFVFTFGHICYDYNEATSKISNLGKNFLG